MEICSELWGENRKIEMANGLMTVMNVETAGSFKAHQIMGKPLKNVNSITKDDFWFYRKDKLGKIVSKKSRAVGLIQFTQEALEAIGEFTSGSGFDKLHEVKLRFAKMGEIKQLDYVKQYFKLSKNKIKSPEDIYLHVFAPKGVGKTDDYVLYDKKYDGEKYNQNKSVDNENNADGKIQRSEILGRFYDSENKGKTNKADKFICDSSKDELNKDFEDIITYHIYANGEIEKHIPKKIKSGYEKKYRYVYHDKLDNLHDLGTYDIIPTQMYGGKKGVKINLINLDTVKKSYKKDNYEYTFNIDSPRKYVNEKTLKLSRLI